MGRFAARHFSRGFSIPACAGLLLLSACGGSGGGGGGSVPVFTSFTASPTSVPLNGTTTLTWATTGEDSGNVSPCTATESGASDGFTGAQAGSGSFTTHALTPGGTHTFTLTCTNGAGSTPQSTTVNVASSPAPTISAFNANPASVGPFDFTTLSWSTTNATTCTGSNSQSNPDWVSTTPVTSGVAGSNGTAGNNVKVTPVAPGTTYTLTCTGSGGSVSKSVPVLTVQSSGPSVNIVANPSQLSPGGSPTTTLSWQTSNATSCEATGGDGTADWQGVQPISGSATVGGAPFNNPGSFSYILICSNANGTGADAAVVTVGTPSAPTVSINITPSAVKTGQSATISWTTTGVTGATSCIASGGNPVNHDWTGTKPAASGSGGFSTGVFATTGTFTYVLSCTGANGQTASGLATVTVGQGLVALDCGVTPSPATAIIAENGATVSTGSAGTGLCLGCGTVNSSNVIDKTASTSLTNTFASIVTPLDLLNGAETLTVSGGGVNFAAGGPAGFLLSATPPSVLTLELLKGLTVQTYKNGVPQELVTNASTVIPAGLPVPGFLTGLVPGGLPLSSLPTLPIGFTTTPLFLDIAGALGSNAAAFYGFSSTTLPFDAIQLVTTDVVGLLADVNVYAACVAHQN